MSQWQQGPPPPQGYYGQGQPPPPGFNPNYPYPPPGGGPYPPAGGYPPGTAPYPDYSGYPQAPPPGYPAGNMGGGGMYQTQSDVEDPIADNFQFSDKKIRHAFIRKVYSILMCQLLVTLGFISLFVFHEPTKMYVRRNFWLFIVAFVAMFATLIALSCCGNVRRKFPGNFICLAVFTVAESFLLGVVSSTYDADAVFLAVAITAVVCLALTIFAFQTKWDFTMCGGILFVCVIVLMLFGLVTIFFRGSTMRIVYGSLGALVFSIYLVYDTQMIMGGKHKNQISPEEYIFAALSIYIDVINLFQFILMIIGASRE